MNPKNAVSDMGGKPRAQPISREEKQWLEEKLQQSEYDEYMQAKREVWLFLRPSHRMNRG